MVINSGDLKRTVRTGTTAVCSSLSCMCSPYHPLGIPSDIDHTIHENSHNIQYPCTYKNFIVLISNIMGVCRSNIQRQPPPPTYSDSDNRFRNLPHWCLMPQWNLWDSQILMSPFSFLSCDSRATEKVTCRSSKKVRGRRLSPTMAEAPNIIHRARESELKVIYTIGLIRSYRWQWKM